MNHGTENLTTTFRKSKKLAVLKASDLTKPSKVRPHYKHITTQCVSVLRTVITINVNYFSEQHCVFGRKQWVLCELASVLMYTAGSFF